MATLTRHVLALDALPDGSVPDVLRLRPSIGSLFVGDAKATESPQNAATFDRLSRYGGHLAIWLQSGRSGVLALAVPDTDAYAWLRTLRNVCQRASLGTWVRGHVDVLETGTAIVWESFSSTSPAFSSESAGRSRGSSRLRRAVGWPEERR